MSDRIQQYPSSANVALAQQWSGNNGQYSTYTPHAAPEHYPSSAYASHTHPSLRAANPGHAPTSVGPYDMSSPQNLAAAQYMAADENMYPHPHVPERRPSMSMSQYGTYGVDSHPGNPNPHIAVRTHNSFSHPHSPHAISPSHAISHSPTHEYPSGQALPDSFGAPLSSSPEPPEVMYPHMATAQYGSAAYAQQVGTSQYPASPLRPFGCDMCALSFNRQHDLKRHRDTHTGEKPFFCNGGCGKTFTRKDALKRHQLVKRCGIDESS